MGYVTTATAELDVVVQTEFRTLRFALQAAEVALESGYTVTITPTEDKES
jgi:hypothetical protein